VADVERSIGFYRDALGLNLRQRMGDQAAFLAAGDYHHHVGVNTWNSRGGGPPPPGSAGLERFTISLPSRSALEEAAQEVGGTDLRDPDGIPIQLVGPQ
jgi:catechol 2,3-dioxygenase